MSNTPDKIHGPPIGETPAPHEPISLLLMEAAQKGIEVRFEYGDNSMVVLLLRDGGQNDQFARYEIGSPTLFCTKYDPDALLAGILRRLVDEMHARKG